METSLLRKRMPVSALFDPKIVVPAIGSAFAKLDPRTLMKNPVMFVLEVVTALTTVILIRDLFTGGPNIGFEFQIILWLWFTVLFANFAEAIAEGRGKAQADALRRTRTETQAKLLSGPGRKNVKLVPGTSLKVGDVVLVEAGDTIPSDGEVVEGVASVNEAAITGEFRAGHSRIRRRPLGGHRRHPGDFGLDPRPHHGSRRLDLPGPHDQARRRRRAPEDAERDRAQYSARRPDHHLRVRDRHDPELRRLRGRRRLGGDSGGVVCHPHSDHDRGTPVGDRHCRHGPAGALQRAGNVRPGRRGRRRRRHASPRQDRHHHARQPAGDGVQADRRRDRAGTGRRGSAGVACRRDPGGAFDRGAGQGEIRHSRPRPRRIAWQLHSVHGANPHERGRDRQLWVRKGAIDSILQFLSAPSETVATGGTVRSHIPAVSADAVREINAIADTIAKSGGTPLAVAKDGRLLGVIHLKDIVKGGIRERFAELRRMGIRTIMITGDNPLTATAIAAEAGVDDFLAQATPEDKLRLIRDEQAKGKLVAMCGDGTNDAPALAQADVGVAMNTGTQAAREAGNMVDLDSNPTKLIEVVEIGKQLLMTRGALTTFSIANDVAKYFAIIPAMFLAFYPELGRSTSCTSPPRRARSCRRSSSMR